MALTLMSNKSLPKAWGLIIRNIRKFYLFFKDVNSPERQAAIELDKIKFRLEKLWRQVATAPFTDDLHM